MELAIQELSLSTATKPITADWDPYKIFQVHDYKSISFLRQSPQVKAASTETIRVFALAYPELLKEKFFVNVPAIMGFMYGVMKLFVAPRPSRSSIRCRMAETWHTNSLAAKFPRLARSFPPSTAVRVEI